MNLKSICVSYFHHDPAILVRLYLLLPIVSSLDTLSTTRYTLHPDGLTIDLHWHLPHLSPILNEDMFYIVCNLLPRVHLLRTKLSLLLLNSLLNLSTLNRSCLSDHLSPHLVRRTSCTSSPIIRAHVLSDHARTTLDISGLWSRAAILMWGLYCVLYYTLSVRAATWSWWSWPGHVDRWQSHGLLHRTTWPELHWHHLRWGPSTHNISDLLLAWPHTTTWPDHISKLLLLLLLLSYHNLPTLTGLLY